MWAAVWAPAVCGCWKRQASVGEDHGGSAKGNKASGSQSRGRSQREWGHGNPGVMFVQRFYLR